MMTSSLHSEPRPVLVNAARKLIASARSERAMVAMDAPERQFYLGVEAGALEILHPELGAARTPAWIERQPRAYREGYLRTKTLIASAPRDLDHPLVLPLPDATSAV